MRSTSCLAAVSVALLAALLPVPAGATFPGANGRIVFVSDRSGNSDIYAVQSDTAQVVRLTNTPEQESDPRSSAQGNLIAYWTEQMYVRVMAATGAWDYRVPTCYHDFAPAWSPDGRLVFLRRYGKVGQVGVMDADGTNKQIIGSGAPNGVNQSGLDWSPDGSAIAFTNRVSDPTGSRGEIWVMAPDGSDARALTTSFDDSSPSWSPDGSRIAFARTSGDNTDIYVMGADVSSPTLLTSDPADDSDPVWSPDGTKIAFVSDRDGNPEIYVMASDGSAQTRVTSDPGADVQPDWMVNSPADPPPPPEGPEPSCTRHYDRSVTLRLSGHLTASGRVSAEDPSAPCSFNNVRIERRSRSGWREVGSPSDFPDFKTRIADRPGRYRVVAGRAKANFYTDRITHVCARAVSPLRRHRHF